MNPTLVEIVQSGQNQGRQPLQIRTEEEIRAAAREGEEAVAVYDTPAYTDTYHPVIWVMFTEPVSATTVTSDSLFVTNGQGRRLGGEVVYDGTRNVARLVPSEPLARRETYVGTVTTDVYDTSGNPLAANYVCSFSTEADRVYLPVVIRQN